MVSYKIPAYQTNLIHISNALLYFFAGNILSLISEFPYTPTRDKFSKLCSDI